MSRDLQTIEELKNLGPKSASWLGEVGIHTREDLARIGSVATYRIIKQRKRGVSLNLLYALEGALTDTHWNKLPPGRKAQILKEADTD